MAHQVKGWVANRGRATAPHLVVWQNGYQRICSSLPQQAHRASAVCDAHIGVQSPEQQAKPYRRYHVPRPVMRQSVPYRSARRECRTDRRVGMDHCVDFVAEPAQRIPIVEQGLLEPTKPATEHGIHNAQG
jgi:transcription initiation factor TFIID subunit TAF12